MHELDHVADVRRISEVYDAGYHVVQVELRSGARAEAVMSAHLGLWLWATRTPGGLPGSSGAAHGPDTSYGQIVDTMLSALRRAER